ncbi:hypothetical protein BBJ28_00021314 [Nothophytophthora sp. Chile5]|nr:hypothetical protein BBJ28_00021314 [Nothophytophthora sp. Chile5]
MLRSFPGLLRSARHPHCRSSSGLLPATQRGFSSSSGEPESSRHWSGISSEYLTWRGLAIASRVVRNMSDFFRYYDGRVFARGTSDEARSSMFVLTQFPTEMRVDLQEFVQGADKVAHTVFEQLYALPADEGASTETSSPATQYLEGATTPESLEILRRKPSMLLKGGNCPGRVVLEQLNINNVAVASVEYTSRLLDAKNDHVEQEWLALQVQYDVTEHLLITPDGPLGIEDRRPMHTRFAWTFEADVTRSKQLEWAIVNATPFEEKVAVLMPQEKK